MKRPIVMLWGAIVVSGLLVVGCNKDNGSNPDNGTPPPGVTNEQTAMVYFANNDEFVNNDEQTIDDEAIEPTDYGTFGKIDAAITPLRWGRFITRVARTVTDTIMPGDSIAFVHVHKVITGILKIQGINGSGDTVLIQKPFTDNSDRNIIFKRVERNPRRFWLNWLPVASSLVDGGTPSGQIDITQLQFITANDTITVTDPLHFFLRYRWQRLFVRDALKDVPEVVGGASVTVRATVLSTSADTDLVALRFGVDPFHKKRMRMQCISQVPNGSNFERVFERTFPMHVYRGSFHAAIDAATRATLFDDDPANYAVSWWGIPYRVN